jgi:hypothetical protein
MVLVLIEQNRTITSQRWLITELMSDSEELTSIKDKLLERKASSTEPVPQHNKDNTRHPAPEHPPRLISSAPDARRALHLIWFV